MHEATPDADARPSAVSRSLGWTTRSLTIVIEGHQTTNLVGGLLRPISDVELVNRINNVHLNPEECVSMGGHR
jgi:hypothetical protein